MKKLFYPASFLIGLILFFNADIKAQKANQAYDVAAYYAPMYHPDPIFKEMNIFKEGNGEWEVTKNAKPKYPGQILPKVPLWGYEDETDPVVMEKKINAAVSYGVNVMIFDWYWYDGKPFLEDVLNKGFLGAKNSADMKFWLMWANHNMTSYIDQYRTDDNKLYWPGGIDRTTFDGMIDHIINDFFKKSNYYKINGEPVFSIYELSTFINGIGGAENAKEALQYFEKKTIEAGFPGLHLQAILWEELPSKLEGVPSDATATQNSTIEYFGFKSMTNYQWCHFIDPDGDYKPWGEKAIKKWNEWDSAFKAPFFPHVSMGWDNNPRYPEKDYHFIVNNKPEYFQEFLQRAKKYVDQHPDQPKVITVNAWNEWSECSYLEPDTVHKMAYLEAVKKIFASKRK